MLAVSSYGSQLLALASMKRNQVDFDTLSQQLATGVKSADLSAYGGTDAQRILDSHQEVTRRTAYNKGIDIVEPQLKAYDLQFGRMEDLANLAEKALGGQDSFDAVNVAQLGTQIDNVLRDLTSLLNERVAGQNVWGGRNSDTPPVTDLTTLPTLAAADPFVAVGDPAAGDYTLPDYHAGAPGTDQAAWTKAVFSPETGKTVQYGQVANEPTIQRLVHALRLAKSGIEAAQAAATPDAAEAAFDSFRQQSINELSTSRSGLRALRADVSTDLKSIGDSRDANTAMINLMQDEHSNIVNVDKTEVAVKLTQVQAQLEATYKATAALTQTSLLKYL